MIAYRLKLTEHERGWGQKSHDLYFKKYRNAKYYALMTIAENTEKYAPDLYYNVDGISVVGTADETYKDELDCDLMYRDFIDTYVVGGRDASINTPRRKYKLTFE